MNQYRLFQILGSGSFGCVRLCRNENDGELYAAKCISKKRMQRKGGLGRSPRGAPIIGCDPLQDLRREIAILKKLDHPHIVRLYEVMEDPLVDIVYMVFELIRLGPVMDITTKSDSATPFSEERARMYFDQLLHLRGLDVCWIISYSAIKRDKTGSIPRRATKQEAEQRHTHGPHIHRAPPKLATVNAHSLGGKEGWSAYGLVQHCIGALEGARDAKVCQANNILAVQKEIGGFDITVDNVVVMQILYSQEQLVKIHTSTFFREWCGTV